MDHKMKEKVPHRLSPHFLSSDEGPDTGDDSEDDLVRSYLPTDSRGFDQCGDRMYEKNDIPAINITLHSPNANRVLEAEICQLADIQDNIQRMREGDILEHQNIESRLSTSCPSLAVEAVKRKKNRNTQQRYRRRSDRNRSPSMSTGDSDEDMDRESHVIHPGAGGAAANNSAATNSAAAAAANKAGVNNHHHNYQTSVSYHGHESSVGGDSAGHLHDSPDGRHHPPPAPRDRSCSLRPSALYGGGAAGANVGTGGGGSQHISLEAVNSAMAKSVSTPHIPRAENGGGGGMSMPGPPHHHAANSGGREEYHLVNTFGKSPRRRTPEPTHVFIQKLIAEHGWAKQAGSGTDSETECDDVAGAAAGSYASAAAAAAQRAAAQQQHHHHQQHHSGGGPPQHHISPQLTLAEFLQNTTASEEEQRKRRRNKKERGGSLFSLRKKKEKKEGGLGGGGPGAVGNNNNSAGATVSKGLTKAGSAASLSRPVSVPRVPQHSYSMSSIKRYPPHQPSSAQFYLSGKPDSSKPSWTEEGGGAGGGKEELDGGEEDNLLEGEVPPGEELPQSFSLSLRNLDADPFLRLQKEEADTWANSIPPGVHSALKPHEAKRQEHIYEFIMTEKHHCQLLKVIQRVFFEGLVSCLDMKPELLDKLFPQLDNLINLHFEFLRQLRMVQDCGTVIPSIADVLLNQFNAESASLWQAAYGVFCSQHTQAVNLYKDLLKTDRRFHEFVQQSSQNPLLRKMGIPECILTISTRITKYPLLIEPLIKTAKDRPEERQKLEICHQLVKSILVDVNGQVAEKERAARLIEIYNRLDAKSYLQVDGRKFKKSDFLLENRRLLFEGVCTLTHPQVAGAGPVTARGNRSPAPTPVNIVVLSDVVVFLQESSQKYVFVTPENRSGIIPVHTLLAKEKPGSDNKSLQIISTADNELPDVYEVAVVQPRDRQDWIGGIRRAVDLSGGGSLAESSLEIEMEKARRQLDVKYMRMKQRVGELREKDVELARTMEDKMHVYSDMFEELGLSYKLPELEYTKLVQERSPEYTADDVLREVNAALQLSSSLSAAGRAASAAAPLVSGDDAEAAAGGSDLLTVAQLTHHLNNILCIVSEKFTSQNGLKVEVSEWKEKAALGLGRYKHNQQLEQLRTQQDQLTEDRKTWAHMKQEQDRDFRNKQEALAKLQASLEQEKKDVEQQRDKLYRKLEALKAQGIDIAPNMTVIGAGGHSAASAVPEPHFIFEVRKAVSPSSAETVRKAAAQQQQQQSAGAPASTSTASSSSAVTSTSAASSLAASASDAGTTNNGSSVNQNLISATIQTKGDVVEVKQQIPSKLAKLSLAGGNKSSKEKKASSVARPSVSSLQQAAAGSGSGGGGSGSGQTMTQQLLPYKLSESDKKTSTGGLVGGGSGMSPKSGSGGYQKLSSSSFAEDRVGRSAYRGGGGGADGSEASHSRTGSSPAAMSGRPMSSSGGSSSNSSNTLPKLSSHHRIGGIGGMGGGEASPPPTSSSSSSSSQQQQGGGGGHPPPAGPPHHHHHHHQPMVHRVNYSDSGEEVFFF